MDGGRHSKMMGVEDIDGICFAFTAPDAGDNDGKRFSMWDRMSAAVLRP